ncbi:MAG: TetR/AcrR family transcriptional regulator [Deltaproteobacteria bacterium]|nr:TetR/AcrR family transcriptional regulator [Deltaproteobacteria bacterium]
MSRYPKGHKEKTHTKIVETASKKFREEGFKAVGVDGVMKSLGLTSGGFLAHFKNKEELFSEALTQATLEGIENLNAGLEKIEDEWERFERVLKRYLSMSHRENTCGGCPFPALTADIPRLKSKKARRLASKDLEKYVDMLKNNLPKDLKNHQDRAWATLALLMGSLSLSRAVADDKLAKRILEAARKMVAPELFEK